MQNLTEYPYISKNLFNIPEKYSYAYCSQDDYLRLWKEALSHYRDQLKDSDLLEQSDSPSQDIACFFKSLLHNYYSNKISMSELKEASSPYVKKYEVFKRLFSSYDDKPRKRKDATLCSVEGYVNFAEVLLTLAESLKDLKSLSCLLKLTDALCSIDVQEYDLESAEKMARIITQEIIMIESLQNAGS